MKISTLTLSAALAATLLAAPATAAEGQAAPSVEVRYDDLDLTTAAGTNELNRRLERAAKSACQIDRITTGTRAPSRSARTCYKETLSRLESRVAAIVAQKARG